MRPRSPWEAADLGVRLCQSVAGPVFRCYLAVGVPVVVLCMATYEIASWLPTLVMWWIKPWLDRTILFVLARAAFDQPTRLRDLWDSQRQVWWSQLLFTLTLRRLSPWRSFTQPAYQLEGVSIWRARKRVAQLRRRHAMPAMLVTAAFSTAEMAISVSLQSLIVWLAPEGLAPDLSEFLSDDASTFISFSAPLAYAITILFLEPFYVGAGFAMYLNRRTELEAWDVEQELRRAFAA